MTLLKLRNANLLYFIYIIFLKHACVLSGREYVAEGQCTLLNLLLYIEKNSTQHSLKSRPFHRSVESIIRPENSKMALLWFKQGSVTEFGILISGLFPTVVCVWIILNNYWLFLWSLAARIIHFSHFIPKEVGVGTNRDNGGSWWFIRLLELHMNWFPKPVYALLGLWCSTVGSVLQGLLPVSSEGI